MNKIFPFVFLVIQATSSIADAYVCILPNKERAIQNKPCESGKAVKNLSTYEPKQTQDQRAAEAQAELDRQREWMRKRLEEERLRY